MKIKVYVSKTDAIVAKSEQFGNMEIDVDLTQFTDAELRKLQNETLNGKAIGIKAPTPEAVKEECARQVKVDQDREAKEAERREAKIQKALTGPIDNMINTWGAHIEREVWFEDVRHDPRLADINRQVDARIEGLVEEKRRFAQEQEAREEAKRAAWNTDKATWIAAHGSDRLKKAHAAGYPHNGAYAQERANLELGAGWMVDSKNKYEYSNRTYPTEAALDLEKMLQEQGYKTQIVWVTFDGKQRDYGDDFEAYEAVAVRGYLDRYDVIHAM